jgi:hypothetical protein
MTKTTRENIAACAAHGFYFWSDHPKPAHLWATDDNQKFHEIRVHRKTGKAEHVCTKYGDFTGYCGGDWTPRSYDIPSDMAGAAQLMGLPEPEVDLGAAVIAHNNLKKVLRKHDTVEELIAPIVGATAQRRPAVVASMITHDPTWMVPFSTAELESALGMTRWDDIVRTEIQRRESQ